MLLWRLALMKKKGAWSWWSEKVIREGMLPQLSKVEVRRCYLPSRSNVLEDFIDKDIHHESTGRMKVMKYLRESCYHHIKCSIANSLSSLMRKWYLNNNFQPYSYSQRLQECIDRTKINTSNLIYMWRVKMKEENNIK